jgi:hypothetical protein
MKAKYETLEDYLDALDAIKEKVAQETKGLTAQQVKAYFARAAVRLEKAAGQKVQVSPPQIESPHSCPQGHRRVHVQLHFGNQETGPLNLADC